MHSTNKIVKIGITMKYWAEAPNNIALKNFIYILNPCNVATCDFGTKQKLVIVMWLVFETFLEKN